MNLRCVIDMQHFLLRVRIIENLEEVAEQFCARFSTSSGFQLSLNHGQEVPSNSQCLFGVIDRAEGGLQVWTIH